MTLLATVGLAVHVAGNGQLIDGLRHLTPERLAGSEPGRVAITQVAAAAVAVGAALLRRRTPSVLALLVVIGAEGWRSHLHSRDGVLGAALTVIHLLVAALWAGGLLQVVRTGIAWRDQRGSARLLTRSYARAALVLVLIVAASGVLEALLLVHPWREWWDSGYGRALLIKLLIVAAALTAAVLGRRRLRRPGDDGQPEPGLVARWELGALAGVLAATAVLISLPTPSPVGTALAAAPAPLGPVVPLGTLVGQVTVGVTASAGQVVVQLSVPGADDADKSVPASTYQLQGDLQAGVDPVTPLSWQRCGTGCFTTPTQWQPGPNLLQLTVHARGWHGGTTTFTIPWYPVSAEDLAQLALARLRATTRLTMTEQVTSDTTAPAAAPQTLALSGPPILAAWPYGSGTIPQPVVLANENELTDIGFAYPLQGIYVRWTVDQTGQLLAQTITTPGHLIEDRFQYP
jgi:copper transport protein